MPNKGIEPEHVDLLQLTISSLVFVNHLDQIINKFITKKINPSWTSPVE